MNKKILPKWLSIHWSNVCQFCGLGFLLVVLSGCGEDPKQLFDTAKFEEEQHNQVHAKELYQRILRDHGESPLAAQAAERLKALKKENP